MRYVQKVIAGVTSVIVQIKIYNSTVTTGAGLTGLTNSTCGTLYYKRSSGTASVSVGTINTISTFGTYNGSATAAAFKEVDSANMPGVYELHLPNNAFVSGASEVMFLLKGGTNAAPVELKFELEPTAYAVPDLSVINNELYKNTAGQRLIIFIHNSVTGLPVTGESSNITSYVSIDGSSFDVRAYTWSEIGNGYYSTASPIPQADTDADTLLFKFSSTTSNSVIKSVMVRPVDNVVNAKLTADGLDAISAASPATSSTLADLNFRDRLWYLAQRFLGKVTKAGNSPGTLTIYNDNDVLLKVQNITDDGAGNQTIQKIS